MQSNEIKFKTLRDIVVRDVKKELKNFCGGIEEETIDKALRIEDVRKRLQFKLLRGWKIDIEELEYVKHIPEPTPKKRKIYPSRHFI